MPRSDNPKDYLDTEAVARWQTDIQQRGWQQVRAELVDRFEDNCQTIEQREGVSAAEYKGRGSKATRLTQSQQWGLALCFLTHLKSLHANGKDDRPTIESLCQAEMKLLRRGYSEDYLVKQVFSKYNNLLRVAIDEGEVSFDERNSTENFRYDFESDREISFRQHYHFLFFTADPGYYNKQRAENRDRVAKQMDDLQPVKLGPYLTKTRELLASEDAYDLVVGIAAATGRRFREVLDRGTMTLPKGANEYQFLFAGQEKSDNKDPYLTYSLVPAAMVVEAIERLRPLLDGDLDSKNSAINGRVQKHFERTGIIAPLAGDTHISLQNLRRAYAAIVAHLHCPKNLHPARFAGRCLGHLIDNSESAIASATHHYLCYFIDDATVEPQSDLETIAARLIQSNNYLEIVAGFIAATGLAKPTFLYNTKAIKFEGDRLLWHYQHESSVRSWRGDDRRVYRCTLVDTEAIAAARKRFLLGRPPSFPVTGRDFGSATADIEATIEQHFGGLGIATIPDLVGAYLAIAPECSEVQPQPEPQPKPEPEPEPEPAKPYPRERFGQLAARFGWGDSYKEQFAGMVDFLEAHSEAIASLVEGKDKPLSPPKPEPQPEEGLPTDVERLVSERVAAVQAQVDQLKAQLNQLLAGGRSQSPRCDRVSAPQPSPTAATPTPNTSETTDPKDLPPEQMPSEVLKGSRKHGAWKEKCRRTLAALMAHNEEAAPEQRWFVSASILHQLARVHPQKAADFLDERSADIDRHHAELEISDTMNHSHGHAGHNIEDFVSW